MSRETNDVILLGVNLDHVATLREARYAQMRESPNAEPDVVVAGIAAKKGGADSITVHVRGDRRHMQESDVFRIQNEVDLPLNLELGVTEEMLALALKLKPDFACLVPETREEVTTEGGLDVEVNEKAIADAVRRLQAVGIRVSLFIDPLENQVAAAHRCGAEMIELHTGAFANGGGKDRSTELRRLEVCSGLGNELGIQVNAGHGINYSNVSQVSGVPFLKELNIGHSIVARAMVVGMEEAVRQMTKLLKK